MLIRISKKNARLCRSNTVLSLVDIDAYQKGLFLDSAALISIPPPRIVEVLYLFQGDIRQEWGGVGGGGVCHREILSVTFQLLLVISRVNLFYT